MKRAAAAAAMASEEAPFSARSSNGISRAKRTRGHSSREAPLLTDHSESDDSHALDPAPHSPSTTFSDSSDVNSIPAIRLGRYEIQTWFPSPFPKQYQNLPNPLYICQFCLEHIKNQAGFDCHCSACPFRRPPGSLVYLSPKLSVFKVDGHVDQLYCHRLTLLAKLFLKDKSVGIHLSIFTFYILCEHDGDEGDDEHRFVGYFSKEKKSTNTLGCILTLPPYQKCGYGSFLISLSYELAKQRGEFGSPEGPLSELGKRSFFSYWSRKILPLLLRQAATTTTTTKAAAGRKKKIRMEDLVRETGIDLQDIIFCLEELELLVACKDEHGQGAVVLDAAAIQREATRLAQSTRKPLWAEPRYFIK